MLNLLFTGCSLSTTQKSASGNKLGLELIAEGFTAPLVLVQPQDDSGQFYVADQDGRIWIITSDHQRIEEPFLDLRSRIVDLRSSYDERGLLGLALHPNYVENGRFFVYYSAPLRADGPQNWDHTSYLSEFLRSKSDPNRADPDSERLLLQIDQPQSNHNGGQIAFGPDGFLYVPLGDGGGANDIGTGHSPNGNAQDLSNF
jgi:glucose/arabinose dehydrogenase